jgi:predicted nucleic acid-binding protein
VRVALDTNVLVYAEDTDPAGRPGLARQIVGRLPTPSVVVPAQVLGELFNVLRRKVKLPATDARRLVARWIRTYEVTPTTRDVLNDAFDFATQHKLAVWDPVILAAAARADCDYLLSEDMQDRFSWRGVTVANPFGATPLPTALAELLATGA